MTSAAGMKASEIKASLRRDALRRRDELEIDDRLIWDEAICERALALPELTQTTGIVSAYWPIRSEADPRPILVELAARGVETALPVIVDGRLAFRRWTPWEPVVPGGFGTLVPQADALLVTPATLIMPLSGFDRRLNRLGYGKGHYDTAIIGMGGDVMTIGIAYAAQEVAEIPTEAHDQPLRFIITERETLSR
jgi:5-formyltetrahydrofolate cyclo-ligase